MTAHLIKPLLSALLSYCLAGVFTGAALANANGEGLVSTPGVTRRESFRSGGALTQTPGGRPEQQAPPAGKRKSLHEYGPEDVHPEAQENENSRLRKDQVPQPKARNRTPLAPGSMEALAPTPMVTPALAPAKSSVSAPAMTPTPTVTPALAPAKSSVSAPAMTGSAPQKAPQKAKDRETLRWKLIVRSSVFLLLLLALIFLMIKMWRQLRVDKQAATGLTSQEQRPAAGERQPGADGQAAAEKRVSRSDINPKRLKTKVRKGHLTRFKKA